jgi:UDP:flavonoid glycosyltransferase YjiC (YdhE family)
VTWEAGGGVPPAIGLGRLLARAGHDVAILAPRSLRARVEAAGCAWRPFPLGAEFDASAGRAADDQRAYVEETFFGRELPRALGAEVAASRPDALVVDALLATTVCAAQATGIATAALVHTLRRFHGSLDAFGRWGLPEANALRAELGLTPIPESADTLFTELQRRCDLQLVALPAELDPRAATERNAVHVGPIAEEDASADALELPWPGDDATPLVVVGLSSSYMHQEALLERILKALAELPVHVLATTGLELDPDEVSAPPGVELRRFVQHAAVMPRAALVVTHAGTGTLMAALAHGVPCVCIPLGRDQPVNAAVMAELGVGLALAKNASVEEIRAAATEALGSETLRAEAGRMRSAIAAYDDGAVAVAALERLATTGRAASPSP